MRARWWRWWGENGESEREQSGQTELQVLLRLGCARFDGLGGDAAGGFQDLAGEIILDAGVFAGGGDEGGAEELFAAVAESAADGFLDLGVGERTLAGALAGD